MSTVQAQAQATDPNAGFIWRAQKVFLYLGVLYALLLVALTIPLFQLHAVYLHALKFPLFADFNTPEKYGFAPHKTHNLRLTASDNTTIGAWLVLADASHLANHTVPTALSSHPTVIYLHGNAATRAVQFRVDQVQAFSSRLQTNVLAIDYRGFGDSDGLPSEHGLALDARAAWDYLVQENGVAPADIVVVGHSLGTGVAARFASELEKENVRPRGLALLAPFSSIRELLDTYYLAGFIPLLKPLAFIPGAATVAKRFVSHNFNTLSTIHSIKAPLVIAHALNDWDIPPTHSSVLFDSFVAPHLPPLPYMFQLQTQNPLAQLQHSQKQWEELQAALQKRAEKRSEWVNSWEVERLGEIEELDRAAAFGGDEGKVVKVITKYGGHDRIGLQEGLQDLLADVFGLRT
ncbi:alpha/beta-hydrolase [Punctularia strigosozonata HHB-11173 SS5]|uniref:alpha/beta-hydrolase n=1 Tax=Punctularia strigosozonata (strain HHB-11173) TaxID=741275 RepID=UPI0004418103|nr:alpha/beta-hydrolase [Punctularia strigosozonata HHB-11173 SS5]EIN12401.1 alpha/beta-hydrolase [Punctularia strigosozonata HHB-11173 SS5]